MWNLKIELPYDLAVPFLGIYPDKTNSKGYIHPNVCYSTIHNSQDMEATQMPIDRWIKKMWCTYEKRKLIAQSLTLWIPGTVPACLLCPWNSPGKTRILEWVAISFSRGSSLPRDQIWVSCIYIFFYIYIYVCVCVCVCVCIKWSMPQS